uniref:Uncharacterized protein n=1 Tax=Anopheles melas TaxID=34690 RepID=A0A182U1T7_9DIPT
MCTMCVQPKSATIKSAPSHNCPASIERPIQRTCSSVVPSPLAGSPAVIWSAHRSISCTVAVAPGATNTYRARPGSESRNQRPPYCTKRSMSRWARNAATCPSHACADRYSRPVRPRNRRMRVACRTPSSIRSPRTTSRSVRRPGSPVSPPMRRSRAPNEVGVVGRV